MTQEKLKRIVTAAAVAGTLLIVSLLGVIVYQLIEGAILDKRISDAEKEKARLEKVIEQKEGDLYYFESELGLNDLAYGKYGFSKPEDKTNNE